MKKATIKTYPTSADVEFCGITHFIDLDYQDKAFFTSYEEVEEAAREHLKFLEDCENYSDILDALCFAMDRYCTISEELD